MSALILKDFYVLWRQMRLFLLLLLVFSAIPGSFNSTFVVVYAAMLPYTALAYDERSKWDQLAAVMPYSTRDIVLGKYVFGWLCIGAAAVLSLLFQAVLALLGSRAFAPAMMALAALGGLCILAISLPVMFRFGVEKGRLMMFLIIFLVCGSAGALSSIAVSVDHTAGGLSGPFAALMAVLPIAAAALTAVSVPLSMKFYARRQA